MSKADNFIINDIILFTIEIIMEVENKNIFIVCTT